MVLVIFASGYFVGVNGIKSEFAGGSVHIVRTVPPERGTLDFSLFWKVWDMVTSSYFDKSRLDTTEMVYGAISGMVASIGDPYTAFFPPSQNKVVEEDLGGSFEGVGIQIGYKGTQLVVIAPLPSSPAEAAGVKAGDFIIGIKDEREKIDTGTAGMSLPDAVEAIRGPAGTKVTLTLLREESPEPITVDIIRAKLNVPTVTLTFVGKDKDIADIKLSKFGSETDSEWVSAISEVTGRQNLRGIILDLRNNPGGFLQGAVDTAGEFLKSGSVVVIEERGDKSRNEYKVDRVGKLTSTPIVVLINGGSASASEILAGALRDVRGIKLVGETTFGKGTIQEPEDLPGGASLHVTVAKWLTPSGFWVNAKGLTPDVKIKDDEKTPEDEQLEKAIELLSAK